MGSILFLLVRFSAILVVLAKSTHVHWLMLSPTSWSGYHFLFFVSLRPVELSLTSQKSLRCGQTT